MTNTTSLSSSLAETLDRLARFESQRFPVVSLYLDARPDSRGRDHYQPFVRKELAGRARTYALRSPSRESFDRDAERIHRYLETQVRPSANGIAIFACAGEGDFFEALQLEASFPENRLSVARRPQLYPLARLLDENPSYAVVLADTRSARIFVFADGRRVAEQTLESPSLPRTGGSGWSQMQYQRHVDNLHRDHAREVIERLGRIAEEESIGHILMAGDEVILSLLRSELPKHLAERVVDLLHFDKHSSKGKIFAAVTDALKEYDAKTDAEKVERLLGEYRAGGLAAVGPEEVRRALEIGQADELLISAALDRRTPEEARSGSGAWPDELVALARQTGTRVTMIEDVELLAPVDGVGARLRYRLAPIARNFAGQQRDVPRVEVGKERAG